MSFGNFKAFSGIPEFLVLALMMVTMFVVIYVDMEFMHKVGIVIFSVTIIFLSTLASAVLRLQKDLRERQLKQA
jgi:type IV secretory pathway VirB3-like protein